MVCFQSCIVTECKFELKLLLCTITFIPSAFGIWIESYSESKFIAHETLNQRKNKIIINYSILLPTLLAA